eukprot:1971642-Prymnesium_polylepis.1
MSERCVAPANLLRIFVAWRAQPALGATARVRHRVIGLIGCATCRSTISPHWLFTRARRGLGQSISFEQTSQSAPWHGALTTRCRSIA